MRVRRRWFLAAVALGTLLNPLNTSMIAVALARLQIAYHLDFTAVSWIVSTFYLASAIAQPAWGKVADLYGRKTVFLVGLVVVAVASIAAPFSPCFGWLIGFRILQSIGSSAIYPAGMALVRHHITDRQAQALAVLSVFSSASAGFGPAIGGLLIHLWNWPAIFVVNIPFIVGDFLLALWILPADARSTVEIPSWRQVSTALDIPGIVLFAVAVLGILWVLLSVHSPEGVIAGLVGLAALRFFIGRELFAPQPFVPLRTFAQNSGMTLVDLQYIAVNILFYAVFFGIPTYLQTVRHVGAASTGFIMLSLAACSVVVAPMAGRWVHRSGVRPALVLAGLLMTVGALWIITFHGNTSIVSVCVALVVFGIANGLNNVGMQTALFVVTPKAIIGTASGLFMTARFVGTLIASLVLDLVFGATVTTAGLRLLGAILAGVGVVIVLLSGQLPRQRDTSARAPVGDEGPNKSSSARIIKQQEELIMTSHEELEAQRKYFQSGPLTLSYLDYGGDSRHILLLLHGTMNDARTYEGLIGPLEGWRVISLDQRGHGWSDHSPDKDYSRDSYVEDVANLIRDKLGGQPVTILGHSLGGINAYQCAARYPDLVQAVMVEDIGVEIAVDMSFVKQLPERAASLQDLRDALVRSGVRAIGYFSESVVHDDNGWGFRADLQGMNVSAQQVTGVWWDDWLSSTCPMLLIHGRHSFVLDLNQAERMVARRANTQLVVFDDCGHSVHTDDPAGFVEVIKTFLDEQHSRTSGTPCPVDSE